MADDKQKQQKSSLDQAASTSHAIKGAAKTGKALSGAAKGAAAGPHVMLATGLMTGRKHIGKILAGCLIPLMLPILFILMLPSLIFGSRGLDDVPEDVLNDNDIIMENLSEVEQAIEDILREKHNTVIHEINQAASQLGEDTEYGISDEFADMIIFESTLIISQFCASEDDYQEINLDKLIQLLESETDSIFSYHIETYTYEITIDYDTGETRTIVSTKLSVPTK